MRRGALKRAVADEELVTHLRQVFTEFDETYGCRRVHAELCRLGIDVGRDRIARLMRAAGLVGRRLRKKFRTPVGEAAHPVENTLDRDFDPDSATMSWCGDITYVKTWDGWAFVATVIDLRTRRVIDLAVDSHMRTSLVVDALNVALKTHPIESPILFHSDRGCQYTSREFKKFCRDNNVVRSNSRKGHCWDNATAESFFATMKREYLDDSAWVNIKSLRAGVQDWVFNYCNSRRRHSAIGYQTPNERHMAIHSVLPVRKVASPR